MGIGNAFLTTDVDRVETIEALLVNDAGTDVVVDMRKTFLTAPAA